MTRGEVVLSPFTIILHVTLRSVVFYTTRYKDRVKSRQPKIFLQNLKDVYW